MLQFIMNKEIEGVHDELSGKSGDMSGKTGSMKENEVLFEDHLSMATEVVAGLNKKTKLIIHEIKLKLGKGGRLLEKIQAADDNMLIDLSGLEQGVSKVIKVVSSGAEKVNTAAVSGGGAEEVMKVVTTKMNELINAIAEMLLLGTGEISSLVLENVAGGLEGTSELVAQGVHAALPTIQVDSLAQVVFTTLLSVGSAIIMSKLAKKAKQDDSSIIQESPMINSALDNAAILGKVYQMKKDKMKQATYKVAARFKGLAENMSMGADQSMAAVII